MKKYISFLIKPASSLCNMRCRYCFYYDVSDHRDVKSFGIMKKETMEALIDKALGLGDEFDISFHFQGGEPTVAGLSYFEDFVAYVQKKKTNQTIHYALQTNASLLNEKWGDFFYKHHFLIGVSLDGYHEIHNHFRKDHEYKDTYKTVMNSIQLLKNKGVDFNILTVLTNTLAKHPQKLFSFYKKNNLKFIQFIPCIPGLGEEKNEYSLSPKLFASFYKTFFDLWEKELYQGNYISVSLFDNVISLFERGMAHQCGLLGKCSPHFVVESQGDIYPCDFYVLDKYSCGNIVRDDLMDIINSEKMSAFLSEERRPCQSCETCPFERMCHKNCKRLNIAYYDDHYCGYRDFLEYAYNDIVYISHRMKG